MKKLFSVILCMALMLSAFAVPALADDAFCKKVDFQNVSNNSSTVADFAISDGALTGNMLKDKNEFRIKFDSIDVTPYVDNGYIGFNIKMSNIPQKLRIYPYSTYTDSEGTSHSVRPSSPYTVTINGMTSDKAFWIYLPLKDLVDITTGKCATHSGKDCAQSSTSCTYTLSSITSMIIQPQIEANDTASKNSDYTANPITVEVKDLGLYVYKTKINGVSKDGYWMPIVNGSLTDGTDLKLDSDFIYDIKISNKDLDVATSFISSGYVMNDGYITFKPNATKTNGLSFYLGTAGLTLPVSKTWLDNGTTRWKYEDYTLRLKIKSATVPKELYIGPMSGYSKTENSGYNAGGIRPIKNCFADMKSNQWFTLDISLYDFIKGDISNSSKNTAKTLGSITLFFRNTDGTALSDIDIAEMAIYGPSRGLTVTNLQITKDSEQVTSYSTGDALVLQADVANTTSLDKSFKTIGAFYNDDKLAGVELFDIDVLANTNTATTMQSTAITVPAETTKFKAFAFSNLNDIIPLCESAIAQIAQ